ncbi:RNA polymerase sigma factor [Chitinophaga caeni]|nr:RNA polymerase sigma-70 factor [Chitinophaga caeni]
MMPGLIARLKSGDEQAFKELLQLLGPKVLNYCKKKVHNDQDAEELLHDIFLKLWHFREKIDTSADVQILLFTMARNHILNFIRKKSLEFTDLPAETVALIAEEPPIIQRIDLAALQVQYQQIMQRLGEKQRKVFKLSREDGFSHKEIAEMMGISTRTVEAHIHSSLKVMRSEFKDAYILLVLFLLR